MRKYVKSGVVLLSLIIVMANCSKWKVSPYDLIPQVLTGLTSNPATTSIQVSCEVGELGPNTLLEFGVVYSSIVKEPTIADTKVPASGTSGSATVTLNNLKPATTYYYRSYTTNNKNLTGYGETKSFTTSASVPNVQTLDVLTSAVATSVLISCRVTNTSTVALKEYGVVYSNTSQTPTTQDAKSKAATTDGAATTITIGSLQPNTTYYCRAYAISTTDVVGYGEVKTAKTGEPVPAVETLDIVGLPTSTSATVQCRVTNASVITLKEFGIAYSSKNALPTAPPQTGDGVAKADGPGTLTAVPLTGLQPNTTYNFRAYVINGGGTVNYGEVKTVKTADVGISSVSLTYPKPLQLGHNSATIGFKVDKPGSVTEYGVIFTPDESQVPKIQDGSFATNRRFIIGAFPASGTVNFEVKDLLENALTFAVPYVKDASGTSYFSKQYVGFQTKYGQRGNWRQLANLPAQQALATVYNTLFTIGGKVYVGGNGTGSTDFAYLKKIYEYDAETNIWSVKRDFPGTSRIEPTVAVLNDKAYILFGAIKSTGVQGYATDAAWEYTPATDTWRQITSNPPVTSPGGTGAYNLQQGGIPFVYNNRVHSLFGRGPSTSSSFTNLYNSLYSLDPSSNGTWQISFPLANKGLATADLYNITRSSAFTVQDGDWVYYGGGVIAAEYTALGTNVNFGRDFNSRQIWGYNARTGDVKKVALLPSTFNDCSTTGPTGDTGGRMQNTAFKIGSKAYIVDCSHKTWVLDLITLATPVNVPSLNNPTGTVGIGVSVGDKAFFGLRNADWWEFTP
jgi:hypothetical protein